MSTQEMTNDKLIQLAVEVTQKSQLASESRPWWNFQGYVGCALLTDQGNVYTGVSVNFTNGIGFCAEHSAIAEMIKGGESRIIKIAGMTAKGNALSPCGRCREMMYQVDNDNLETVVLMPEGKNMALKELLPVTWQQFWDA